MAELLEARVPDIGGHSDVPVIELLVKPGDTVAKDQGLSRWSPTRRRWKCRRRSPAWSGS